MSDFEKKINDKKQEFQQNNNFPNNDDLISGFNSQNIQSGINPQNIQIEKQYFVLNKQLYTSQRNNVTCKINYYEPSAITRGQGANAFYGILTASQYVDRRYYDHLDVGLYTFVYELSSQGHELRLVAIKPYLGSK